MEDRTAYNPAFLGRPQAPDPLQEEQVRGGYQQPLAHPESVSSPPTQWEPAIGDIARASRIARRENAAIKRGASQSPYYDTLHDRLQTTQGWRYVVDTVFEGPINLPAAGASALTPITRTQPILPGYPGDKLVYPYVNMFGIAVVATTITGFWYVDLVIEGTYIIPLTVFAGNPTQANFSPDLLSPIPIQGGKDDSSSIAQIRVTVPSGTTFTGVTAFGLASMGYAYRYIARPEHAHERGE